MVFDKEYSSLYDRFYREKDYASECDLIEDVFKKYNLTPKTLLDLGCGTGGHASLMTQRGYAVTGVDRSDHMLEKAREKAQKENLTIDFTRQDITRLKLDETFDAVVSMFAVIGYITGNDDLDKVFKTIREHLTPGGVFIMDCWYGPTVLSERPETRIKTFETGARTRALRMVTPKADELNHVVNVHYHLLQMEGERITAETSEIHAMRYFFPREIEYFLKKAGFTEVGLHPFDDIARPLTLKDWNMLVTAR